MPRPEPVCISLLCIEATQRHEQKVVHRMRYRFFPTPSLSHLTKSDKRTANDLRAHNLYPHPRLWHCIYLSHSWLNPGDLGNRSESGFLTTVAHGQARAYRRTGQATPALSTIWECGGVEFLWRDFASEFLRTGFDRVHSNGV